MCKNKSGDASIRVKGHKNTPPLAGGQGGVPRKLVKTGNIRSYQLGEGPHSTRKPSIVEHAIELRNNLTEAEKKLWYGALSGRRLEGHKFRRQQAIGNYIVDFVCMDKKLVIELDGGQHNEDSYKHKDNKRTVYLESQGYRVIRFWNHDVMKNLTGVVDTILAKLSNGNTPPFPPASGGVLAVAFFLCLFIFFPAEALGQSLNIDLGDSTEGTATGRLIQLIVLITIITLAPALLIMMTSFTRIIIVLSLLRTGLGLQQTPPNQVLIGLALFLTFFIMAPTFEKSYEEGLIPLLEESITQQQAMENMLEPFKFFMLEHTRTKDLDLFMSMQPDVEVETPEDTPLRMLIPAFMISELKRAFEIGFLVFLPFVIIDMLIASILMAMGMMMLPPVMIALPFKVIFFVLIDGWYLVAGSLVRSFG